MSLDDYSIASSDPRSILLPLLKPEAGVANADAPPLHSLPDGKLSGRRVAFKTSSQRGGEVDWVSTTHTFPAAYPRTHPLSTRPPSSGPLKVHPLPQEALQSAEAEKAFDRRKRKEDDELWKSKLGFIDDWPQYFPPRSAEEGMQRAKEGVKRKDPQLWNVIQRIAPSSNRRTEARGKSTSKKAKEPVTLFLAHATGFHKEIYEPFVKHLAQYVSDHDETLEIDEIWSLDTIISGESALLNAESFGPAVHWLDAARDIIQFASAYMPTESDTAEPAAVLSRSSTSGAERPRKRRIIGMGHSYAGAAIALVANTAPEIFERIILLDPILIHEDMLRASIEYARENPGDNDVLNPMASARGHPLAMGAALRKDVWASREAAERSFRSKPFFRAWEKSVLDLHLRFGLAPLKGAAPQVTLAMPKWLEASSFAASWTSSYARASMLSGNFKKYHADSGKGQTHIIIMSGGNRTINLEAFEEELGDSPEKLLRGTVEVMEGGHLSAQEQPSNLALWVLAHLLDRKPPATKPDEVKAHL